MFRLVTILYVMRASSHLNFKA